MIKIIFVIYYFRYTPYSTTKYIKDFKSEKL